MVQMGTYNELMSSSASFAHLLEDIHQQEQESSTNIQTQQSVISSIHSEKDDGNALMANIDTKQEGSIKWSVYTSYIKAGLGCVLGFPLILLILIAHQATFLYSSWWLATWSDDEGHRHRDINNCTLNVSNVLSMTEHEWNAYRNRRFYIYCGELDS